ncbi:NAD(P)-dependent dehydrogenase (short-subunit alcohol dehydrogenase family) [Rhizobium soli]|uniref:NAD(P)-dependent dehydrogenase (Short-subunit alcohol dehydrogenase family) n=2 Tax=Rhizobium soli TaxID=424798 RepID=A0A7X0JQT4_9HYPH|nr:NAD(P)-dependent dehydrogenase (short-subunit alcohol dehydrogenase family) [Rhizobium soli]
MRKKTVLITGANKSIGLETARQLGNKGYSIWLGSRDAARGEEALRLLSAEGVEARSIAIDVTDEASVRKAADRVQTEDGKLDVLINNAGIPGQMVSPSQQSINDIRQIYETNVFAPIVVTQAFIPLLRKAGNANIVLVSSGLGSLGWLSDPGNQFYGVNFLGYNSSKTALNAITVAFAKELAASGIKVNAADPGYTATDFNGHSGYRTVEQAASGIVWIATLDEKGPTGGFYFDETVVPW